MQIERYHPTYGRVIFELSLDDDPAVAIANQVAQLKAAHSMLAPQGYTIAKSGGKMDISTIEIDAENGYIVLKTKWLPKFVNGQATKDVDIEGKKRLVTSVFGAIPNTYDKSKYTNYCPLTTENAWAIMQNITKIGLNDFDYSQLTMYLFGQQAPTPAPKPTPPSNNPLNQQSTTKRRLPAAVPPDTSAPPAKFDYHAFLDATNIISLTLLTYDEVGEIIDPLIGQDVDTMVNACKAYAKQVPQFGEIEAYATAAYRDTHDYDDIIEVVHSIDQTKARYTQRKNLHELLGAN